MRWSTLWLVVAVVALCCACGLSELIEQQPGAAAAASWSTALDESGERPRLTIRRRTAAGDVAATANGVRLVLKDGVVHELPFETHAIEDNTLRIRCASVLPDHAVTVAVIQSGDILRIEVEDNVELASQLAELSLELALHVEGIATVESFLPQEPAAADEVAGDLLWRTPLAFARLGRQAIAVLPDVTTARARVLPGALELNVSGSQACIRHGLVGQRIDHKAGSVVCRRDPTMARRVAGQSVGFAQEVRLFGDAQSGHTLAELARDVWQRLAVPTAPRAETALGPQVDRLLNARAFMRRLEPSPAMGGDRTALAKPRSAEGGESDSGSTTVAFSARQNALLLAAALATRDDGAARADARRLVQLAVSAPLRSGLSPDRAQWTSGRVTWSHDETLALDAALTTINYDATAVAWTRVCGLLATRRLAADDEVRVAAERVALTTAKFLLANQLSSGAIPALYETQYLAPVQQALYEPAAESGAAALLLAECAGLGTTDAKAMRDAALAAVLYLQREVQPEGAWHDRATLIAGAPPRGRGNLSLTFAALAGLKLSETVGHAGLHAATAAFIDSLALQQQVWSPRWLALDPSSTRLIGGLGQHDGDPQWSDPTQALSALAFLLGYERFGRRDLLQRGAWALRAALATAPDTDDKDLDARSPLGTAAAVAQLAYARWGSVIVDAAGGYAESLDAVQASLGSIALTEITLLARCAPELVERTRATFRGLGKPPEHYSLGVNDGARSLFSIDELAAGVSITPLAVPSVIFAPPTTIQANQPFSPRVRFAATPPAGFTGGVKLTIDGRAGETAITLVGSTDPRTWLPLYPFSALIWADPPDKPSATPGRGAVLRARVELLGPQGQRVVVVPQEPTRIDEQTTIDLAGTDDTDCLSASTCPRVLFADGSRLARAVGSHGCALEWQLNIPATALALELEILLAGQLRLQAQGNIVHEDTADTPLVPRWVRVKIADRRLWEAAKLKLTFTQAVQSDAANLQVAELRTRVVVDTGTPADQPIEPFEVVTRPDPGRKPDSQLRVLVVPVAFTEQPLTLSNDQIATLFFGDDYQRTPAPQPRHTTGSVRNVLLAVSGGRTRLVGEVADAPPPTIGAASDLLGGRGPTPLNALVTSALRAAGGTFDVILLVHSGPAPAVAPDIEHIPGLPPIALIAERGPDRSALAVGDALAALLAAHHKLARRSSQAAGNFGALALNGHTDDHLPAAPIGFDLAAAGWVDVVAVHPEGGEIAAAPMLRERRVHRLASELPCRGDLFLEVRGGLPEEPLLPESGLLGYWHLPEPPLVRGSGGATERPTVLRLARSVGVTETPFVPGTAADLVRRASVLDDVSSPSLATPQGELCFLLESVGPVAISGERNVGERIGFTVRRLARNVLEATATAQIRVNPTTWTALALDGVDRGLGAVVADASRLRFTAGRLALRANLASASVAGRGQRLFANGRVEGGPAHLRIGYADTPVLDTVLTETTVTHALAFDLPAVPQEHNLWFEVEAKGDASCVVTLTDLIAVPRVRADHAPLRAIKTKTARLSDGFTHAPLLPLTTGSDARAVVHEPVLIRAHRTMLRLRCGFAADAPAATTATVDVRVDSLDGKVSYPLLEGEPLTRGEGTQPLLTALLAIPNVETAFVGTLSITLRAPPGTTLWIATAEVARP